MSNKNTVVRAIRIDSSLDKAISTTASEKGLSFNLLVNQILSKYAEFDRVAEKLGFIGFAGSSLRNFLTLVSDEEAEKLGAMSGFSGANAKQFTSMLVGNNNLEGFLEALKLMEKYLKVFSTEISQRDDGYLIVMTHSLGGKWSLFLKGMMLCTLNRVYGLEPEFEITENFLTTRFMVPSELVAKSSN